MCKILYFNFFIFASFVFFFQVNGEIYNHEELRSKLKSHKFRTGSDCEVIAHLVSIDSYLSSPRFAQFLSDASNCSVVACTFFFKKLNLQYEEHGEEFVDMLDGMFSFVLLDTRDKSFIAARDAIGITPLYLGWGLDGMQSFLCDS